jgi:hypothetical protein
MTINPLSDAVPTEAAPQATVVKQTSGESKPQPAATDTVTISSVNKAALQELTETSVQTAMEARSGDVQAKRLLAREAAAKAYQQVSRSTQH